MQQHQTKQWRLAVISFWTLLSVAVATYVVISNATYIDALDSLLSIDQYIKAMVGLFVLCVTCGASALGAAFWLVKHKEFRPR